MEPNKYQDFYDSIMFYPLMIFCFITLFFIRIFEFFFPGYKKEIDYDIHRGLEGSMEYMIKTMYYRYMRKDDEGFYLRVPISYYNELVEKVKTIK